MNRIKSTVAALAVALGATAVLPAQAQNYPTKPVRIVIPYQAAGAVDIFPRMLAERMSADLGQPFIIENKPGGLAVPAMNDVLSNPADGYTILAADAGQWGIIPALQPVTYDFLRDFAPVSLVFTNGLLIVTGGNSGINSLQDLIKQAKAKPGALNYATPGIGSLHHLVLASLAAGTGMDVKHIPYKGAAEQAEALLRGDVAFTMISGPAVLPHAKVGKMKILAVNVNKRFRLVPDVPTVAELTGMKDFDYPGQQGFVVKAGTPKAILDRLSASMRKLAGNQDFVNTLFEKTASEFTPTTPEALGDLIRADIKKFTNAVKVSGAKAG